ncbi:hypothetical protein [Actinoplanes regularis]|uniref:hypothetical protein n=1 Tax=Actinoplanes regularis TaxID=52697 RepID=UPI0024A55AF2|nr:hypothetical protein [Actinoplanes regularis]GLW27597.1 hypothetical protein Areg01_05380 [Actinoplanes regularis]
MTSSQPRTVQIYCRLTVTVEDPEAVTALAVQQLQDAGIDWPEEDDDLATATAELEGDLLRCIAAAATPHRMLDGVPGLDIGGGHLWAEYGAPSPRFVPSA